MLGHIGQVRSKSSCVVSGVGSSTGHVVGVRAKIRMPCFRCPVGYGSGSSGRVSSVMSTKYLVITQKFSFF